MTNESTFVCPADACNVVEYEIIQVYPHGNDNHHLAELDEIVIGKYLGSRIQFAGLYARYKVVERTYRELIGELKARGYNGCVEVD